MKSSRVAFVAVILMQAALMFGQTQPNLETGYKPYGSHDVTSIDSINTMNGDLQLHIGLPFNYPQRGDRLALPVYLHANSKGWHANSYSYSCGGSCTAFGWGNPPGGIQLITSPSMAINRVWQSDAAYISGAMSYYHGGYYIVTRDGANHVLSGNPATADSMGEPWSFDASDTSGLHLELSGPLGPGGVPSTAIVTDRNGNQYQFGPWGGRCRSNANAGAEGAMPHALGGGWNLNNYGQDTITTCNQRTVAQSIKDSNGNVINFDSLDTLGRSPYSGSSTTDYSGCVGVVSSAMIYNFAAYNGGSAQLKLCSTTPNVATAFNVPNVAEYPTWPGATNNDYQWPTRSWVTTAILPDGSKYTFSYDNYGEITAIGLPTGGSISYTWTTIALNPCTDPTPVSRAVASRSFNDGLGHTQTWSYVYSTLSANSLMTTVTDPNQNDTVHIFSPTDNSGCMLYETSTRFYSGSSSSGQLLKQVDTHYLSVLVPDDTGYPASMVGNIVPDSVKTTVYPSNKMTQVTKSYDPPQSSTGVIFGNVVTEKLYDWGPGGPGSGPGALLRETDTVYQWQKNSSYLTAHIVDLPASTVVIDPVAANNTKSGCPINAAGGTASCIAETDPFYDEAAYLTASGITTQHVAPPAAVRGNLTTLSHWLNTANSFVSSHTNWYDTGEPYQNIDPLGHTTTLTYDSAYVGAYVTQTCSPQTGTVTHCVIGTYDFNTGLLTSFTDQNGQTSNYGYDLMSRMTSAQAPPDLANGSARATTSLSYATTSLPWSVTRTRSITSTLTDSATSVFDGLGRSNKGQHPMPGGTATVDTVYDPAGHVASVTNPYFSTSDPTYGITSMQYDALDRVTHTTKQDGSISTVSYSDNCITVTDEAGKQRRTCSDALGRLAEVDEPSTATLPAQNNHATMQTDGNFVLYSPTNTVLWSTGTAGTNAPGPIYMQDDGNLVLYLFKWQIGTYAAPSPGPFAPASCSIGTYLMAGQRLNANQCISSPHGQYILLMAGDGTFFIYDYAHNVGTWGPGTSGHPGAYAILQTDGNFVVYASNGVALWSSGTSGTNANRLNMEDDGRVIIYRSVWNSGTSTGQFNWTQLAHPSCDVGIGVGWTGVIGTGSCIVSPNGHFELLMQSDGNLVINDLAQTPAATLWSAGTGITAISPGIAMQTLYQYDALGDLLRVDQKGSAPSDSTQWRTRLFTYDSLGRLRTAQNPESGTISYAYDNDSELLMKTSPAPNQTGSATQTISYCYDELHRVTKRDYAAHTYAPPACPITTAVVSYTYDAGTNANGKLTHLVDQAGTADYFYDPLGRMTSETRVISGISKSLSYGYNLDGSLKTMTYPSGRIVTYTPDSVGRPVSTVDSNGANYVTSAAYNAASSLTSLVNGNSTSFAGITKSFLFNPRLQLCRITAYSSGSVPGSCTDAANHGNLMDRGYNYNLGAGDNGNVMGITNYRDTTRSQSFIYDALNRLTSGWSAANTGAMSWGETYSIDPWGNLMIAPMANKANGGNFQHAGDYQNHAAGLGYDAVGNMTNYTAPGQFVYDQENRLLSTAGMTYTYDANDERVLKSNTSTGAALKRYWSGAGNIVAEADGSGTLTAEYIYFGGKRVARIDLPANSVHYYLSDHLSSTSVVASSAGAIEEESDYYPFGTEVVVSSTGGNKYKFTGKERDLESGLDYFRARHYGSTLGRFISSDPLGGLLFDPQSLNKYTYVRNNALRYTDPTGMYICADSAKCDSKQDIAFEKARQNDLKSKDENVVRGASAYGDKNTDNGTTVKFGDPGKGNDGITKNDLGADPKDPNKIRAVETVTFRDGLSGAALDAAVGHEGSHVADAQDFAASITAAGGFDASKNLSKYQTELKAYVVTQSIMSSENEKRGYGNCGMRDPCALGVGVSPTQARDTINRLLANPANGYGGITPQNPGPTLYPSLTPPK